MKRVLIIYFSQSGQLTNVVQSIASPLQAADNIDVLCLPLRPKIKFPFPWPFLQFFNTFPEAVYADADPIEPLPIDSNDDFDLIILAYQVWFLSPSLPTTAFLQSDQAKTLLKNKPVITAIACRNMWLTAQEKIKASLQQLQAHLIDNIVLIDSSHSALTFLSTPIWVLTGNKGPLLGGIIPKAGINEKEIQSASRFGYTIANKLASREKNDFSPMLKGLNAVTVNEHLIASEKIAHRSFCIWGKLLRFIGKPESRVRQTILIFYIVFLITLILTVVPISAIIKTLISPLTRQKIQKQRRYYAAPSGEGSDHMESFR